MRQGRPHLPCRTSDLNYRNTGRSATHESKILPWCETNAMDVKRMHDRAHFKNFLPLPVRQEFKTADQSLLQFVVFLILFCENSFQDDMTALTYHTYHMSYYLSSFVHSILCPVSDRCETTDVPVPASRRSAPVISRFNPVTGVVNHPTSSRVSGS